VKSGGLFTKGMEEYMKTVMGIAQASAERQGEAFKKLLSCKTLNEVTEAQNKIAQDNFEELMQTATKLSEIGIKLATEVLEPISSEVSKNVQKATDSMAA
jgi:phasin family protein